MRFEHHCSYNAVYSHPSEFIAHWPCPVSLSGTSELGCQAQPGQQGHEEVARRAPQDASHITRSPFPAIHYISIP